MRAKLGYPVTFLDSEEYKIKHKIKLSIWESSIRERLRNSHKTHYSLQQIKVYDEHCKS